jgi:thiol-disulfide isomerase/thioredoxin
MSVQIGSLAPKIRVSEWVQGRPIDSTQERGNVVVVEVFQVNCPGCFLYGLPEIINLYNHYRGEAIRIFGLATAFEDYDKNTLSNLKILLSTGEVIGETLKALQNYGHLLAGNKLPYAIPFPVAMDLIVKESYPVTESRIKDFIEANIEGFRSYSEKDKLQILDRARKYLELKKYSAKTFEDYSLRGTPSTIIIDKKGILRHMVFGANNNIHSMVQNLLQE